MRILLLNWRDSAHPAAGGAEVWAHKVAEGLADLGHEITFFSAAVSGAPIEEAINGVHMIRRGSRFGVYREARKYFQANNRNFDVILEEINTRPFFAHSWGSIPVVPMIHQVAKDVWKYEAPFPLSAVGRYLFEPRWLRRLSNTRVMTLSPSSAESLIEYGIKDSVVVLPGSDDEMVRNSPKNSVPTVVFLGRLVASKRPDHVIEAFRLLRKAFPTAELWMMGSGQMLEKIRKEMPKGVSLFGHVSFEERQMRLATAHVLVATTVREGWGLNVSEASAVGTPTIGYNAPGLRDSIPMSGGFIVPVSPMALGEALVKFFNSELVLEPKIATQPWSRVCLQIEEELKSAIKRFEQN
jgi:glycosyltransferase involved in cell wall biosynthesis